MYSEEPSIHAGLRGEFDPLWMDGNDASAQAIDPSGSVMHTAHGVQHDLVIDTHGALHGVARHAPRHLHPALRACRLPGLAAQGGTRSKSGWLEFKNDPRTPGIKNAYTPIYRANNQRSRF